MTDYAAHVRPDMLLHALGDASAWININSPYPSIHGLSIHPSAAGIQLHATNKIAGTVADLPAVTVNNKMNPDEECFLHRDAVTNLIKWLRALPKNTPSVKLQTRLEFLTPVLVASVEDGPGSSFGSSLIKTKPLYLNEFLGNFEPGALRSGYASADCMRRLWSTPSMTRKVGPIVFQRHRFEVFATTTAEGEPATATIVTPSSDTSSSTGGYRVRFFYSNGAAVNA